MITLVEGGFFAGGRELLKSRIEKLCDCGKKAFLIVPEQDTVSSEDEMAEYLSSSAPLYVEVTNFTRFSDVVFRSVGGTCKKNADSARRALVMWKVLTDLAPTLEASTQRGELTHGRVIKALAAVKQMQNSAVSAADLFDAGIKVAEHPEDARLRAKLSDISKIMVLYNALMSERGFSYDDELLKAAEKIRESNGAFLADTEFFIDGFTSFTEPQYRVIAELAKHCRVTVSLIIPKASPEAYEYSEARDTHKKLVSLASKAGVDVKLERIDGRAEAGSLLLSEITDMLWKSNGKIDTDSLSDTESLKIFEADTPYEECEFIAEDIRRRVICGADYSDFGIIVRNSENYRGILDVAFEKANVPLFLSQKTDVCAYEAVKLIYSALSAVCNGFERADVISYAKCSLSGLRRELADELELYCEKWQINGKRFTDGIAWNMNPAGYTERRKESDEEKLLRIENARNTIINPLSVLNDGVTSAKTVKDYSSTVVDFLTLLNIEEKLKKSYEEEKLLFGGASQTAQIWKTICTALDTLCEVLGDEVVTPQAYFCLLKITFSEVNIGKIPAFSEEVAVESANVARMRNKKHVYILGANAGVFPATADEDYYFTDKDKSTLSSLGLDLFEDSDIKGARELYYFTRALSFAKRSVTITYSSMDVSFKAIAPSDAIARIKALTGGRVHARKISSLDASEKTFSPEYAIEHLTQDASESHEIKSALRELGFDKLLDVSSGDIKNTSLKISEKTIDSLYGKSIPMTQSKLELFAKCPMSYFCTYNIGLKDNERAEFDARNIGNFLHAVLEKFFYKLKELGKSISEIDENEKLSLIHGVAEEYISHCFEGIPKTSARLKHTVNKLTAYTKPIIDNLCDEFSDCKYEPTFFELEINNKNLDTPSPVIFNTDTGKKIYISGKIDRVDVYESDENIYVRVIDYKSGKKVFSPSDIENGMNLQMFLYLKAIVDTDNRQFLSKLDPTAQKQLIPAGVLYVKAGVDDVRASHNTEEAVFDASKDKRQRIGMILEDEDSISAMNQNYIPVKFKKNGEPDSYTRKYLYTQDGWEQINKTIENAVKSITEKMLSGSIDALPFAKNKGKSDVCEYCKFKPICRNAN